MSHYCKFIKKFTGHKTFQLFGDSKSLPPLILEEPTPQELVKYNNMGYGIFICVNETDGKGRKADNVKRVRYVFADLDGVSPSKMLDDLPNFVVQSSPGKYHGYWSVESEFPLEGFKSTQKAIAYKYGSDPAVNDLSRVMRVAGFYHQKNEPCKTEIVFEDTNPTPLSYSECVAKFPPEPKKQWTRKAPTTGSSDFPQPEQSMEEILDMCGWTFYHGNQWTREGKGHGCSGVIQESGNFYVFTSASALLQNKSYDRAGVMMEYHFGGDAKKYLEWVKK